MLEGIQNNLIQNNQVANTSGMDKAAVLANKNPYDKMRDTYLVDKYDISDDAIKMYQKEFDIKKFTDLALSNPDDTSHNTLVASQIANGEIELSDEDILDGLFSNQKFFDDLLG